MPHPLIMLAGILLLLSPFVLLGMLGYGLAKRRFRLVAGASVGLIAIAALMTPNLLNAILRGKQKRSMSELRTIGTSIESYILDHGHAPLATRGWVPAGALRPLVEPTYIKNLPTLDGWGNPILYDNTAGQYVLLSRGRDNRLDAGPYRVDIRGATQRFEDDMVYGAGVDFR